MCMAQNCIEGSEIFEIPFQGLFYRAYINCSYYRAAELSIVFSYLCKDCQKYQLLQSHCRSYNLNVNWLSQQKSYLYTSLIRYIRVTMFMFKFFGVLCFYFWLFRRSLSHVFYEKDVLRNFVKLTWKQLHPTSRVLFLIKLMQLY